METPAYIQPVGRWWLNLHSQEVYWCPVMRAFLECPDDVTLSYASAIALYVGDDQSLVADALRATAADGQARTVHARRYTFTGRIIEIIGTIKPVIFNGKSIGLRGSYHPAAITPQPAARSTQHAARSTQHAARSTQHAARKIKSNSICIHTALPYYHLVSNQAGNNKTKQTL